MTPITARIDIVTGNGFVIAKRGDTGVALRGVPNKPEHGGMILVYLDKRTRAYWADPRAVDFTDPTAQAAQYHSRMGRPKAVDTNSLCLPAHEEWAYDFGANLKKIRQARRTSQTELGRLMGKHGLLQAQSTVCHWESRSYCPNGQFVNAAAKALQCPPWIFFIDLQDHHSPTEVCEYISSVSS